MDNKNESQSYKSEINNEDSISNGGNSNSKNNNKMKNYKSQSNTTLKLNKLEKNEESLLKRESHKVPLSQYYNKELSKKYANFLKSKRFKISNIFDEKNSKKFLDKKDKCMQRIVLPDIIDEKNKDNPNENEKEKAPKVVESQEFKRILKIDVL